jgi:F0F1-type ATP synthase assembly protein I
MEEKKKTIKDFSYLKYSNMAFQILGAIGLGTWIGIKLDAYMGNKTPYATAGFALLGTLVGLYAALYDLIFPKK